ncbi:MAG: carboxymuconolactone decarboxylase family protein [Actinomycetia bacterium]|nr:carboxymuconolactone decarboxylase family protein [Actinomycetes bacterium]
MSTTRHDQARNDLSHSQRELVALGAALGSNCVPCIEYHIPESRKAGLSDAQISVAIELADKVRQVPARKVLDAAMHVLGTTPAGGQPDSTGAGCSDAGADASTEQPCCT